MPNNPTPNTQHLTPLIRPFEPRDLKTVVELLWSCLPMEAISETRFVRQVLLDINLDLQGMPVAEVDGKVVGFALGIVRKFPQENATPDFDRGYLTLIAVAPEYRREGIGRALLQHVEAFAQAGGAKRILIAPYSPNYFLPAVDLDTYPDAMAFFLSQGYQEVYRPIAMAVDLWNFVPPPEIVEKERRLKQQGIVVETYRVEWTLPLLDFLKRDFPGDWQRFGRETIHRLLNGDQSVQMWLAHDASEVLGFIRHEGERYGPVAVAPKTQGKGIGQVLTLHCIEGIRALGYRTAWFLWSDDQTAARLYNRFGFREFRRYALLKKEF